MFSLDDAYQLVQVGRLIDFEVEAYKLDLIDKDKKPCCFLFLAPEGYQEVLGWPDDARDAMLAEMTDFLLGEPVTWGDPQEGNCVKPLHAKGGWLEFKVRTNPHARVFSAFVAVDVMIGVRSRLRKDVPADNLDQLDNVWRELWGDLDVGRMSCEDPHSVLSKVKSVTP